jgi:glyoxylase-like metal-dependent hydrolase (beta-lactamase superfamily II)
MGQGDTTWVAEYAGCVADYLASLQRLRTLPLDVLHPAHGPSLHDPSEAFARFAAHRRGRIEAVQAVLTRRPDADEDALFAEIYGESVPPGLEAAARQSLRALREYVDTKGGKVYPPR